MGSEISSTSSKNDLGAENKKVYGLTIPVRDITVDTRVSIREETDEETVKRYVDSFDNLPPVTVFKVGDKKLLLVDGFHRLAAATNLGKEYIEADVREGSYEDAAEFAAIANLKHGKPLTPREHEKVLLRLRNRHADWTQEKLALALGRSQEWVSSVIAADRVEKILVTNNLDTWTKSEISRAPEDLWVDIASAAEEQSGAQNETREKVKAIKAEPDRAQEIIQQVRIEVPETPSDKLIPLTKYINKLCEMLDQIGSKLDPSLYDWGSGALAVHVLHGHYILAEKISRFAENTKRMIEFLESRKLNGKFHACSVCGRNFKSRIELNEHQHVCEEFIVEQANEALARMEGTRRTKEE